MDQKGDYITIERPNKTHDYNYPRKSLEFLLSICIISFFLFYFSGLHELQFPTMTLPIFDRKCMFLICNGILAFLAKNLSYDQEKHAASMEYDDTLLDNIVPQDKNMSILQQEDEDYGAEKKESVIVILDDEEESVDDELEVSTEELNNKFEEFIRRMKEEIRIDNI